ncbi:MAG TPA: hypothetical protein EYP58_03050, partial [bacterium (Candidatus Stahlbacteria)]|nr:hypothetical protein [Candidatus Stahlbacteria bacterium]
GRGGHCFGEHWIYPEGRGAIGFIGTTIPGGLQGVKAAQKILIDQEWILGHSFLAIQFGGAYSAELFGDPLLDLGDYTAYPDHPDLCVRPFGRDIELGFPYPYPREDDSIPIKTAVWNIGAKDIVNQPFKIRVELFDPAGAIIWSKEGWLSKLGSRDSVVLATKFPASVLTPGVDHYLTVTADVEDVIEESWEGNNQSTYIFKILAFYPRMPGWPKKVLSCEIPTLADLDGDGTSEIIITTGLSLTVYNTDGTKRWRRKLFSFTTSAPVVADLDQDGSPEVIVFARPRLCVFEANGKPYEPFPVEVPDWANPEYVTFFSAPAVADLDQDGDLEIVGCFFHRGDGAPLDQVFVWQHDGSLTHEFHTARDMDLPSHPALADIDGDGGLEITVSEVTMLPPFDVATEVFALSGVQWTIDCGRSLVTPAVGNLTGGSETEIVLGHENSVYCFYWTGTGFEERWHVTTEGPVASSPAVADFDRELPVQLDVMFGSDDMKIRAVEGELGWPLQGWPSELPQGPIPQSPAMVRVDAE